ncbi:MAG: hypothetical protein ACOC29_01110, partial [Candidatus Sumerlaeota bacterium]
QESDARIEIEKVIAGGELDAESEKATREFMQKLIEIRFLDGKFKGGHAGGNLAKPDRMWGRAPWPEWQENTARLFERAHKIQSKSK